MNRGNTDLGRASAKREKLGELLGTTVLSCSSCLSDVSIGKTKTSSSSLEISMLASLLPWCCTTMLQPFSTLHEPTQRGHLTLALKSSSLENELSEEPAILFPLNSLSSTTGMLLSALLMTNGWKILRATLPELKSVDDMTVEMYKKAMMVYGRKLMDTPPKEWTFGGLERGPDGRFSDVDLAEIIKDCIEEPAHAFGAHGSPASLKVVDLMGQLQARDVFNVCTMNE